VEEVKRGTAAEDPEEIAQKLQQSKEMVRRYGSALKRTQRKSKSQGLPPVHVPNWFMERRITLRESRTTKLQGPMRRWDCVLNLNDERTGEQGALSYPFWNPERGAAILGSLCGFMLTGTLDKDKIERVLSSLKTLVEGEDPEKAKSESNPLPSNPREMTELHLNNNISPIILAEIRATVTACLSTTMPSYNSSFPSTKTNLILHGTSPSAEITLTKIGTAVADDMDADLVNIDAQDLAQIAGDYLGEGPEPTPHTIRSLGYETYKVQADLENEVQETIEEAEEQTFEEQGSSEPSPAEMPRAIAFDLSPVLKALGFPAKAGQNQNNNTNSSAQYTPAQNENEVRLEDMKLGALLEALVDSTEVKRQLQSKKHIPQDTVRAERPPSPLVVGTQKPDFFDYSMFGEPFQVDFKSSFGGMDPLPTVKEIMAGKSTARPHLEVTIGPPSHAPRLPHKPTIIHVKDIKELNATHYGSRILQKLEDIVRKRRAGGQSIMILGTTCSRDFVPELSANGVRSLQSEGDAYYSRTIVVPMSKTDELSDAWSLLNDEKSIIPPAMTLTERFKHQRINLRHLYDMLRSLDPKNSKHLLEAEDLASKLSTLLHAFPDSIFQRVWPYDEVHRIALTAVGLHLEHPSSPHLNWAHVTLAAHLIRVSDKIKFNWTSQFRLEANERAMKPDQIHGVIKEHKRAINKLKSGLDKAGGSQSRDRPKPTELVPDKLQLKIDNIVKNATKHEKGLVRGIINPAQIKTTFSHVHVPHETIEAVRTLTSLSLLRPDAFNYGVLATDKISGILLYGPPGTGKTLLAKAVAKESGATVLEVSGSVINDKYVGEGEKNVAAIFTLARKLSPCVVFLDEADAVFGSRDGSKNRVTHRDVLNQFLKEWDGLTDMSVFIMVATNRPFDLDDAVIRRLPRRLLVDLPTKEDRRKILEIHLRDEQLGLGVDIEDLAKRTPFYSGSDLKNLAVAAALACVREENEQAVIAAAKAAAEVVVEGPASDVQTGTESVSTPSTPPQEPQDSSLPPIPVISSLPLPTITTTPTVLSSTPPPPPTAILSPNTTYTFPLKRTLEKHHFEKALLEISASISEDMTSLNAIKKFDEQYGDRKGRKKRNAYGFGLGGEADEKAGRVRG
jgi:SpoVK/Ycf46/Vps4 family AAA+-type ATPase